MKCIAEIGLNHLGDAKLAKEFASELIRTDVYGITLQIRELEFYNKSSPWMYPLNREDYSNLKKIVQSENKKFGLAVGDLETAVSWVDLQPDFWKVLSWGLPNVDLLNCLVGTGKPVYVSTGISSLEEVKMVSERFDNILFIHTQLSTELNDVNLSAIKSIKEQTGKRVAFGLHCPELDVLAMSLAFYPESIFFYVKGADSVEYPDDSYAVSVPDVDRLVTQLRQLSEVIGDGTKKKIKAKTLPDSDPLVSRDRI